jgi:hypothetical protein
MQGRRSYSLVGEGDVVFAGGGVDVGVDEAHLVIALVEVELGG